MSRYENELVNLTPDYTIVVDLWLKNIVTLPGTLLCPSTQAEKSST